MVSYLVVNVKNCMNEMLCKETFDFFLLQEAIVKTYASFTIDGHRNDDYFTNEELEEQSFEDSIETYDNFRSKIYNLIKGKKLPLSFQLTLVLPRRVVNQIIEANNINFDAANASLVCNFKYIEGKLTVTTGINMKVFTMDKSLEEAFDKWIYNYLVHNNIELEERL